MIEIHNLSKIYGQGDTQIYALKQVKLSIQAGEYCAIMGASGSGKSTLMNIIGCLDQPTSGDYFLDGQNVATLSDRQLATIRNRNIGFVFQQFHLLPQMSALENVILPMVYGNVPPHERRDRAVAALTKVGLGSRLYNRPNQLSGGQQQRVAIARAIVNKPLLLLADEPTGALDSRTTQEILALFQTLHDDGMSVVMVTHETEVARQTKRIIWLRDGSITHPNLSPAEMIQVALAPSP
ncbi:ABC transporter ATP-binding protein [Picosynechococcus sp. PCC 11901]|uniref:ABC transporter ATP-binding protein n=1 Tax=unclassified Picosynechococcus TaxID=3079910 RepID=UPI000694BBE9|nr:MULTISPECIES: ABC transporter ATP-binding protein [unclassified Picosynechococcus]QCS49507.1 ABC transporter ATP-binding protein [Picosynechococcus sp. PCC 11901]